MKPNLKSMTRKDLEKLRGDIDKALEKLVKAEKSMALAAAEKAARRHGFSLAEIVEGASATKQRARAEMSAKTSSRPKYADPEDKTKTWTGKGRQPSWFKSAISAGKNPEDLAI